MFGRGVAALLAGKQFSWRRHAELHRSSPILVLRGSFRPRFGSGVLAAVHLIHLSTHMGLGVPETRFARAAVDLRAEGRRRARSRMFLGTRVVAKGHVLMGRAQARWNEARARSCCAAGVLPWWSGGAANQQRGILARAEGEEREKGARRGHYLLVKR